MSVEFSSMDQNFGHSERSLTIPNPPHFTIHPAKGTPVPAFSLGAAGLNRQRSCAPASPRGANDLSSPRRMARLDNVPKLDVISSSSSETSQSREGSSRSNLACAAPCTPRSSTRGSRASSLSSLSSGGFKIVEESLPGSLLSRPGLEGLILDDFVPVDDIEVGVEDIENSSYLLGSGAQGKIFRALLKGQTVAAKVSKNDNILREYAIIQSMPHPSIIRPIAFSCNVSGLSDSSDALLSPRDDQNMEPEMTYIACYEFAAYGDLVSFLSRFPHKRRDEAFLTRVFDSILSAMDHLSVFGYLHGDLKPENILVMKDESIRLADFGLCQKISDEMEPQGTPSFLAPEILSAWAEPDEPHRFSDRADVFSFGVLVAYLLSGKYPYRRLTARLKWLPRFSSEEIAAIFTTPKKILRLLDDFSPKFTIIAKLCLRIAPEERPSARRLRQLLIELTPNYNGENNHFRGQGKTPRRNSYTSDGSA